MENTLVAPEPNQEVIAQKRNGWAQMGEAIYLKEMNLQASAQYTLLKVKLPTSIEEVPAAEVLLKEIKADQKALETSRKEITSRFDEVATRLMGAEKSLIAPIAELNKAIIDLKKEYEIKRALENNKREELKRIREWASVKKIELDANYKSLIAQKVSAAYEYALGEGNINPENLEPYLQKVLGKLTVEHFTPARLNPTRQLSTPEEVEAVINEVGRINPEDYVAIYVLELQKRFSDYEIAFSQKENALKIAAEEKQKKMQAIQAEEANQTVAVQLDSASSDYTVEPAPIKALKKCYEVDMPENVDTVIKLMAAFTANLNLCLPKLKVNKWFSFTPLQVAAVLGKCKTEDNAFQPASINFKEVDKL